LEHGRREIPRKARKAPEANTFRVFRALSRSSWSKHSPPLHDPDLLLRQPVQLIHQPVDLPVGGFDLALEMGLFVRRFSGGELLVQGEHALDEGDHVIVTFNIDRI